MSLSDDRTDGDDSHAALQSEQLRQSVDLSDAKYEATGGPRTTLALLANQ